MVRVWMPDRPGALGQVASRIGAVRGDVLAIEILEHGAGRAIDELSVRLPDASVLDLLAAEVSAVEGVDVESIRAVDEDRADPSLAAVAEPLRRVLQTQVRIEGNLERGHIEIDYFGAEDLERISELLLRGT